MGAHGWSGTLARWAFAVAMPGAALAVAMPLTRFLDQVPSPPFVAAIFAVSKSQPSAANMRSNMSA